MALSRFDLLQLGDLILHGAQVALGHVVVLLLRLLLRRDLWRYLLVDLVVLHHVADPAAEVGGGLQGALPSWPRR